MLWLQFHHHHILWTVLQIRSCGYAVESVMAFSERVQEGMVSNSCRTSLPLRVPYIELGLGLNEDQVPDCLE